MASERDNLLAQIEELEKVLGATELQPAHPAQWKSIGSVAEVVVTDDVTMIGLGFRSLPPNPLIVKKVVAGAWGAVVGILPGDTILELNYKLVGGMDMESFGELMNARPLIIKICRISAAPSVTWAWAQPRDEYDNDDASYGYH